MNKGKWVALVGAALLVLLMGCRKQEQEKLKILVASDIHYLSNGLKDQGQVFTHLLENGDGRQMDYVVELTDAFLAQVVTEKPDVLLLTGDLTFNGEKESHEQLAEKLEEVKAQGIKVYVIPGNHDINNPFSRGFKGEESYPVDTVTPEEFREIYKGFGYSEPLYAHNNSLSYVVPVDDTLWLYMMDTNIYSQDGWDSGGMMGESLRQWLDETLTLGEQGGSIPLVATHHNLVEHNPNLSFGFTLYDSEEVLKLYNKHQVPLNLSGHIHVQHIGRPQGDEAGVYDIASGSLAINPAQYGVLTLDAAGVLEYSTASVDVEGWAKEMGMKDPNLLNYKEYNYNFFKETAYKKFYDRLEQQGIINVQDKQAIGELIAVVNTHYFAGDVQEVKGDILASPEYQVWLGYGDQAPFKGYVDSMLSATEDNTHLTLALDRKSSPS